MRRRKAIFPEGDTMKALKRFAFVAALAVAALAAVAGPALAHNIGGG